MKKQFVLSILFFLGVTVAAWSQTTVDRSKASKPNPEQSAKPARHPNGKAHPGHHQGHDKADKKKKAVKKQKAQGKNQAKQKAKEQGDSQETPRPSRRPRPAGNTPGQPSPKQR